MKELFELRQAGELKKRGTFGQCSLELHRSQSKTIEQALKEGWTITPVDRIKKAVALASDSFWNTIAEQFPEMKTGDLPPDTVCMLKGVMLRSVAVWVKINKPR